MSDSPSSVDDLIGFWQTCRTDFESGGSKVHPDDRRLIDGELNNHSFHLGLWPVPYVGNLRTAKVFVLMKNPGYGIGLEGSVMSDDQAEQDSDRLSALKANLFQSGNQPGFYPLHSSWANNDGRLQTGANAYWTQHRGNPRKGRRMNILARKLVEKEIFNPGEDPDYILRTFAALQLHPYHSESGPDSRFDQLPSSVRIKTFLLSSVLTRAEKGEVFLVFGRGATRWGLKDIYDANHPSICRVNSGNFSLAAGNKTKTAAADKLIAWLGCRR